MNQRKFIVKGRIEKGLKKIYLVHYNGFIFPTNRTKMQIIREREDEEEQKLQMKNMLKNQNEEEKSEDME